MTDPSAMLATVPPGPNRLPMMTDVVTTAAAPAASWKMLRTGSLFFSASSPAMMAARGRKAHRQTGAGACCTCAVLGFAASVSAARSHLPSCLLSALWCRAQDGGGAPSSELIFPGVRLQMSDTILWVSLAAAGWRMKPLMKAFITGQQQ